MGILMPFRKGLQEHLPLYLFVSVLFIMGVIFGSLMVNSLTLEQKQEIYGYLGSFFHMVNQGGQVEGSQSLFDVFIQHGKWLLFFWLLGLSVIGLPIVFVLVFLKGMLAGFTIGYLVGQLSWKGMLLALVSVVPQNVVIIPIVIMSSVTAFSFSMYLAKYRIVENKPPSEWFPQAFYTYTGTFFMFGMILFLVSLFEVFISPEMISWVTPMLTAFGNSN